MAKTYSALGPSPDVNPPNFTRQLALMVAARRLQTRRGPGGHRGRRPQESDEGRTNRRRIEFMQRRGMRQQLAAGEQGMDLRERAADLAERGADRADLSFEQRLEDETAGRDIQRQRLGFDYDRLGATGDQFGQDLEFRGRAQTEEERRNRAMEGINRFMADTGRMKATGQGPQDLQEQHDRLGLLRDLAKKAGDVATVRALGQEMSQLIVQMNPSGQQRELAQRTFAGAQDAERTNRIENLARSLNVEEVVRVIQAGAKNLRHYLESVLAESTGYTSAFEGTEQVGDEPTREDVRLLFRQLTKRPDIREAMDALRNESRPVAERFGRFFTQNQGPDPKEELNRRLMEMMRGR